MSDNSKIEWTHVDGKSGATWNPVTGCDEVSEGCDHCLAPETRVLRADMTWVPIDDVHVGDRLVSFTESPAIGQNRTWEECVVQAKWEVTKPTVEVELANGARFTASEDHLWLIAHRGASTWWRQTIGLNFKTSVRAIRCEPVDTASKDYRAGYIAGATAGDGTFRWDAAWRSDKLGHPQSYWRVAKPDRDRVVLDRLAEYLADFGISVEVRPFDSGTSGFTPDAPLPMAKVETRKLANMPVIAAMCDERDSREWMAGWLAGMFDTDASYTGGSLRFCQAKPNDVLDRVQRYGKELGFVIEPEQFENAVCPTARLAGGIAENIAFLSAISPAMSRRCRDFYGKRLETPASPVVGVHRGPARRLIDIQTSSRTFIAEGALTHNCYAKTFAERWRGIPGHHFERGFDVTLRPERLDQPLRWARPRGVFVNSMSDLFHKDVPDAYIACVFTVMAKARQHTFQVLTKRHARMRSLLNSDEFHLMCHAAAASRGWDLEGTLWPLPNVWLGVSAEDQHWADIRIPALLDTPAAVRFISAEPLLGRIDLREHLAGSCPEHDFPGGFCVQRDHPGVRHLSWLIVGGESGAGARRMDEDWARTLAIQAVHARVPVFVKQMGSVLGRELGAGPKGGDWDAFPEDLKLRQFPRVPEAVTA